MTINKAQVISANDLLEGDVVYLDRHGSWTRLLSHAELITDEGHADTLLAEAKECPDKVIDPYLLKVTAGPCRITPLHIRERLRDRGPSTRPEFQRLGCEPPAQS
jgi:hypothetical protein